MKEKKKNKTLCLVVYISFVFNHFVYLGTPLSISSYIDICKNNRKIRKSIKKLKGNYSFFIFPMIAKAIFFDTRLWLDDESLQVHD